MNEEQRVKRIRQLYDDLHELEKLGLIKCVVGWKELAKKNDLIPKKK